MLNSTYSVLKTFYSWNTQIQTLSILLLFIIEYKLMEKDLYCLTKEDFTQESKGWLTNASRYNNDRCNIKCIQLTNGICKLSVYLICYILHHRNELLA